jgi:hypothetical protein
VGVLFGHTLNLNLFSSFCSFCSCRFPNRKFEEAARVTMSYTNFQLSGLADSTEAVGHTIGVYGMKKASALGVAAWPYVTVPSQLFHDLMKHVRSISFSKAVWTVTLVNNVTGWEDYMQRNNDNNNNNPNNNTSKVPNTSTTIYSYGANDTMGKLPISGSGPYTPVHQLYPFPPPILPSIHTSMINLDTSSSEVGIRKAMTTVQAYQNSVLSGLLPLTWLREAYPGSLDDTEPLSLFLEPVHKEEDDNAAIYQEPVDHEGGDDETTVAYVQSLVEWQYLFSTIPVAGVLCYVENTCGDSFRYILNGPPNHATLVRGTDASHRTIQDISLSSVIGLEDSSDAGIDMARQAGVCVYTLTIYPTVEFRNSFNIHAGAYTAVVGISMFLMVGAFFVYDRYVCMLIATFIAVPQQQLLRR